MIEVEACLVGYDEREVGGCHGEYVAEGPSFEEIECDVSVELEEGLEGDQPLLELLVRGVCPVGLALETRLGPAVEKVFHRVHSASDSIIGYVDRVIKEEMRRERENLWDKNGGSWLRHAMLRLLSHGSPEKSRTSVM